MSSKGGWIPGFVSTAVHEGIQAGRDPARRGGEMRTSVAEVARAFEINPNLLHRWRQEFRQGPGNAFPGLGKRRWEEGRLGQMERKIGQQALEIDFLKGCFERIDEQRKLQDLRGFEVGLTKAKKKRIIGK